MKSIRGTNGDGGRGRKALGKVAFALGGLAGNNAHGVGFLAATLDKQLKPDMISCTSGQIFWVSKYLECLEKPEAARTGSALKTILDEEIRKVEWFPLQDWNLASLIFQGRPGVYQPVGLGYIGECWHNMANSARRLLKNFRTLRKPFFSRELVELPPAHLLEPDFPDAFYEDLADKLQNSDIGIAFNSYNPAEGREYVYLNQQARELLKLKSAPDAEQYEPGHNSSLSARRAYEDITPQAVRRGLWLYWYGFGQEGDPHVDGAYFRQIMLAELTYADTIFAVRPLHFHWSGELPCSLAGLEDLKTKLSFNGAYAGERYQIELVNKLLADAHRHPAKAAFVASKYHHIELEEIEMDRPRGFFGYAFEDMAVYEEAYQKTLRKLANLQPIRPSRARTKPEPGGLFAGRARTAATVA